MICPKCGRRYNEGTVFCTHCGERCVDDSITQTNVQENEKTEKTGGSKALIGIAAAIGVVCVVLLVTCVSLIVSKGKKSRTADDVADSDIVQTKASADEYQSDGQNTEGLAEPLYGDIEIPTIVLHDGEVTTGQKSQGMLWDDSFFNWLEDVDATSDADGNIYRCSVEKTLRYNSESGYTAEYDVYRDADTNQIYKVVSIEPRDDEIVITDYYYKSGRPNFIFYRSDSIYTPTYASIDIVGQRFYFKDDAMVRWGTVETPGVMGEYVLTKTGEDYPQLSYYDQTATVQGEYDWTEETLLKEAYNVYNDLYGSNNVGTIRANAHDVEGTPAGGLMAEVYRSSDDVLLYRTYTDDNGDINLNVLLDGTEFYIVVYGGDIYEDKAIYGLRLDNAYPMNLNDSIVMHKAGGDEYGVTLCALDSTTVSTDEGLSGNAIPNATVYIRNGASSYSGDVVQTATTGEDGKAAIDLKTGTYTVQIDADGYSTMYYALEVGTEDTTVDCYAAPINNDNKKTIVLTWDNPDYDLDLTVFTPYQGSNGDMAYIGSGVQSDSHGNYIQSDNSSSCEVAYIDGTDTGDYKIYVNNYTDTQAGNLSSAVLGVVNVHVYIYANNVLVADYTVPIGANGVVWEVVEISGTTYLPCQRVYSDVSGKKCWNRDKTALDTSSDDELYARFFNGEVGANYFDRDYELYYDTFVSSYAEESGEDAPEIEWFDLDNDGKNEPYWGNLYTYGIVAIDAINGKLYVIAEGGGTAEYSSYTVYKGETYLVTSDTWHQGRQTYNFRKLNGNGDIVDEFDIGAEYWDEPNDYYNENSDFYYRGESITMEEFDSILNAYFAYWNN